MKLHLPASNDLVRCYPSSLHTLKIEAPSFALLGKEGLVCPKSGAECHVYSLCAHWQVRCDYLYIGLSGLQRAWRLWQPAYVRDAVFVVVQGLPVCWPILCTKCVWRLSMDRVMELYSALQCNKECAYLEVLYCNLVLANHGLLARRHAGQLLVSKNGSRL